MLRIISILAFTALLAAGPVGVEEVEFTEVFLNDEANIAAGKKIWRQQCARCHGKRAYPGKAPKLKPAKYTPEFVYRRVTKGFKAMPSWKKKYDLGQRMNITAYVMSRDFTN